MLCDRGSEPHPEYVDLSTSISGLRLRNPLILASGILGVSGKLLRKIGEMGAGAVVTKSFSKRVREGYPGPVIVEVPCGLLNSMGLPNPGVDEMKGVIVEAKRSGVPVIASIFGFDESEYGDAASASMEAGADALELNISCPHVSEVGVEIGRKPDLVSRVTSKVKSVFEGPVIVKLSPNVTDIVEVAEAAVNGGADALTATNTMKAMAIDVETQRPILGGKYGGLSGPALKPIALRCVYELYERVDVPTIHCSFSSSSRLSPRKQRVIHLQ
ncbi:dihydroorotate dehydrogenase [Candidatus Bathyarchaeota archaeon]|nr:dihydroorotate dehydrogenase [Candidatus Bathyarchaeota archaeon]